MKKIRILQCFGAMNMGGAETLMINLLSKIDKDKYQCDFLVFSTLEGAYDREILNQGCNIYRLKSLSQVGLFNYIKSIKELIEKNGGYDIVHSHLDWLGGLIVFAAHKAGVKKRIVHSHAVQDMFDNNILKHYLIYFSKMLIQKYATDYLACSELAAKSLFLEYENTIILKNAINLDRLTNPTEKEKKEFVEKYNLNEDNIILGNIGGMSKNKNLIYLIELLEELNQINNQYVLFLVGNGEEENNLKEYVNSRKIKNVFFEDKTKQINIYLSMFDIFLFPSYREGLGMVALEAQAMGVPCIISDTIPKDVDVGANLIKRCSLSKNDDWLNAILRWNRTKEEIDKMKNLIIQKGYDIESNVKLLQQIYEDRV